MEFALRCQFLQSGFDCNFIICQISFTKFSKIWQLSDVTLYTFKFLELEKPYLNTSAAAACLSADLFKTKSKGWSQSSNSPIAKKGKNEKIIFLRLPWHSVQGWIYRKNLEAIPKLGKTFPIKFSVFLWIPKCLFSENYWVIFVKDYTHHMQL